MLSPPCLSGVSIVQSIPVDVSEAAVIDTPGWQLNVWHEDSERFWGLFPQTNKIFRVSVIVCQFVGAVGNIWTVYQLKKHRSNNTPLLFKNIPWTWYIIINYIIGLLMVMHECILKYQFHAEAGWGRILNDVCKIYIGPTVSIFLFWALGYHLRKKIGSSSSSTFLNFSTRCGSINVL